MSNTIEKYYLHPGYVYFSQTPCFITTVLGSCVSLCMHDKNQKYGGMNHYVFPIHLEYESTTRYGDVAINKLIQTFLDFGSDIKDIVCSVIGGGYMKDNKDSKLAADANIFIAKKILGDRNIPIIYENLGGTDGRKVIFNTFTNEMKIEKIMQISKLEKMAI